MNFITLIRYCDIFSIAIPIVIGMIIYKQTNSLIKFFLLFLFYIAAMNGLFKFMSVNGINTAIASKINLIGEFVLLCFFYYKILSSLISRPKWLIVLVISLFLLLLFTLQNSANDDPLSYLSRGLNSLVFMLFSLLTIYHSSFKNKKLEQGVSFLNYGILLFSSSTIVLVLFSSLLLKENKTTFMYIWIISNIISILTNLIFTLGIWKSRKSAILPS